MSGTGSIRDSVKGMPDGVTLEITVRPGSRSSGISGFDKWRKRIEIKVKAPPVDGSANNELISLLAGIFTIPSRNISILSGETSTSKKIFLSGLVVDDVIQKLEAEMK